MEPTEPRPQETRSAEFNEFSLAIIDSRHELEQNIRNKATRRSIMLSGYSRDDLRLPSFLNLPSDPNGLSGTVDFEVQTVEGSSRIIKISIHPDDAAPLVVHDDEGIIIQESGETMSPLHTTALNETLFSLFPENVRFKLTVDNAIEVITQLSPQSSVTYEFQDDSADFLTNISISNTETIDDSIFSLEITKKIIHQSGNILGTRMNLSESIQRQISGSDHTKNAVSIDVSPSFSSIVEPHFELSFEALSDDKVIAVPLPTRRHIDDIVDAMSRLSQNGFNTSNTGAA